MSYSASHPSMDTGNLCGMTYPAAPTYCTPNATHPDMSAPAKPPIKAPAFVANGKTIPRVKTPKVVPAAIPESEAAIFKHKHFNQTLEIFKFVRVHLLKAHRPYVPPQIRSRQQQLPKIVPLLSR